MELINFSNIFINFLGLSHNKTHAHTIVFIFLLAHLPKFKHWKRPHLDHNGQGGIHLVTLV